MTSKLIVNELSADTGITTITVGDNMSGVTFKTGTSNVHATGYECTNVNATGIITATKFVGAFENSGDFTIDDWVVHAGDTNTKFGFPAADTITAETGGSERIRIASDGDITHTGSDNVEYKMKCGTSSGNNILAFLNSGGTTRGNITYDSDNNFLFFNVNQAERLRITSAGKVGINQTAPEALLHIEASSSGASWSADAADTLILERNGGCVIDFRTPSANDGGLIFSDNSSRAQGTLLYQHSDNSLRIGTNGAERFRITSAGNIGIGTDAPTGSSMGSNTGVLHLCNLASNNTALKVQHDTVQGYISADNNDITFATRSNHPIQFQTNSTERLRVHSSGEVTIGTATGTGNNLTVQDAGTSTTAGGNICARFQSNGAGRDATIQLSDNVSHSATISMLSSALIFKQAGAETFRITSAGSFGIGTNAPTSKFDVHMSTNSGINFTNSANNAVLDFRSNSVESCGRIRVDESSNGGFMDFYTKTTGGTLTKRLSLSTDGTATATGQSDGVLQLDTSDSRGAFVRFGQGGSYHHMVGCGDGLVAGAGKNDLGLRSANQIYFCSNGANERMRLANNGTLFHGASASTSYGTNAGIILSNYTDGANNVTPGTFICSTTDIALIANLSDSNDGIVAVWRKGGSSKGSVQISGNSTSYNTSSDYRLKENNVAIADGITRLKLLKPYRFNWKSDPGKTIDGFFAHEVTPAVPEAVNGEKDAAPGDCGMGYQSMDHSKLVPLLTAALQEEITKREALEARIAALEGS